MKTINYKGENHSYTDFDYQENEGIYTIMLDETEIYVPENELIDFIEDEELNQYCDDWSDHNGEHVQDCGEVDAQTYLEENTTEVINLFLQCREVTELDLISI